MAVISLGVHYVSCLFAANKSLFQKYTTKPSVWACICKKRLRSEGVEPPTVGSGIQRSTTELTPQCWRHTHRLRIYCTSIHFVLQIAPQRKFIWVSLTTGSTPPSTTSFLLVQDACHSSGFLTTLLHLLLTPNPHFVSYYCSVCHISVIHTMWQHERLGAFSRETIHLCEAVYAIPRNHVQPLKGCLDILWTNIPWISPCKITAVLSDQWITNRWS